MPSLASQSAHPAGLALLPLPLLGLVPSAVARLSCSSPLPCVQPGALRDISFCERLHLLHQPSLVDTHRGYLAGLVAALSSHSFAFPRGEGRYPRGCGHGLWV